MFTLKDFRGREEVYSYKKGRIVTFDEIKNLSERDKMYLDKIGEDKYEIIELPGCCINHSCDPNIEERNRMGCALRDIRRGEEITIDYDKIAYLEKPFECHCDSKNCRRFVRGKNN